VKRESSDVHGAALTHATDALTLGAGDGGVGVGAGGAGGRGLDDLSVCWRVGWQGGRVGVGGSEQGHKGCCHITRQPATLPPTPSAQRPGQLHGHSGWLTLSVTPKDVAPACDAMGRSPMCAWGWVGWDDDERGTGLWVQDDSAVQRVREPPSAARSVLPAPLPTNYHGPPR